MKWNYLKLIEQLGIKPNFFCSEEYWNYSGWKEVHTKNFICIVGYYKSKQFTALPPFDKRNGELGKPFYAGFSNMRIPWGMKKEFFDYEFIYDPSCFLVLEGSKWKKVRKCMRQCYKDTGEYFNVDTRCSEEKIYNFVEKWSENLKGEFFDPETILKYLLYGENRYFILGYKSKKLYGICCWDENYKYINFRYCAVLPEIRGLSDTVRVRFYQTVFFFKPHKLVNDGGSLGKDLLYKYKLKLNPLEINKIYRGVLSS